MQLGHIQPALAPNQLDLFNMAEHNKSDALMMTIDKINQRFHQGITVSTTGINNHWQTPVKYLSQRYTTNWDELAVVKCL